MSKGFDIRGVANIVLDEGRGIGAQITNLNLNKILYFINTHFIAETGDSISKAKIEAWKYGPVYREIYNQFKAYGRDRIVTPAMKVDFTTGEKIPVKADLPEEYERRVRELTAFYAGIPTPVLVEMSHERGGAWYRAWHHAGDFNIGMEITDEMIRKYDVERVNKV
ncbi:Panacea domain-containing protein [Halovulum sp. GXIMD14794]